MQMILRFMIISLMMANLGYGVDNQDDLIIAMTDATTMQSRPTATTEAILGDKGQQLALPNPVSMLLWGYGLLRLSGQWYDFMQKLNQESLANALSSTVELGMTYLALSYVGAHGGKQARKMRKYEAQLPVYLNPSMAPSVEITPLEKLVVTVLTGWGLQSLIKVWVEVIKGNTITEKGKKAGIHYGNLVFFATLTYLRLTGAYNFYNRAQRVADAKAQVRGGF